MLPVIRSHREGENGRARARERERDKKPAASVRKWANNASRHRSGRSRAQYLLFLQSVGLVNNILEKTYYVSQRGFRSRAEHTSLAEDTYTTPGMVPEVEGQQIRGRVSKLGEQ
jgi:hypothetical protein